MTATKKAKKRTTKVKAGGIIRTSSDSTWRTPKLLRERVAGYFEGVDFLDPCAPPDNPLGASRFFCGPVPGGVPTLGPLFGEPTQEEANRLDGLAQPWDLPWYANIPFSAYAEWGPKILAEVAARPRQPGLLLMPVNRTEEHEIPDLLAATWRVLFVRWPDKKSRHRIPFESSLDGVELNNNPFGSWVMAYGGEPAPGRWWRAFGDLGRSFRVEEVTAPVAVCCREEDGSMPHDLAHPRCPLHAPGSDHGEAARG